MADYYAKIYERRAQLASKLTGSGQKEQVAPTAPPPPEQKRPALSCREDSQVRAAERKPLEQVGSKANEITERVKELDSVSERIKSILSHKRTPTQPAPEPLHPAQHTPRKTATDPPQPYSGTPKPAPYSYTPQDYSTIPCKPTATDLSAKGRTSNEDNFNIEDYRRKYLKDSREAPPPPSLAKVQSKNESLTPLCLNLPPLDRQPSQEGSEVEKMLNLLCRQVQLEQRLRVLREKFDGLRSKEKWQLLKEQLQRRDKAMQEGEIEKWVEMHEEEFDPFAEEPRPTAFPYPELVDSLLAAREHWQNTLRHSLQLQKLEQEGFSLRQLDLDRKGHLSVSDIACFLNSRTGANLRSRDLFALCLRLSRSSRPSHPSDSSCPKLSFDSLLGFLAS